MRDTSSWLNKGDVGSGTGFSRFFKTALWRMPSQCSKVTINGRENVLFAMRVKKLALCTVIVIRPIHR
ncbi:hypothetical protein ACT691_05970 [Vibrio metschnikovii]